MNSTVVIHLFARKRNGAITIYRAVKSKSKRAGNGYVLTVLEIT
jgi:hypothetical protein